MCCRESKIYNAKVAPLKDLLLKGDKYDVPKYQRPYAWEEKHWDDLWNDLQKAYKKYKKNEKQEYLLGSVYLGKTNDDGRVEILDGQQRFTTLYILLKHLGFGKICDIELGGNDREFFEKIKDDKNIGDDDIKTASQRKLKNCNSFFKEKAKDLNSDDFKEFVQNQIFFIKTTIDEIGDKDKTNSIITFITQTDRGKRLSNLEKIKSNLYYAAYAIFDDMEKLKEIQNSIQKIFGECYEYINTLYDKPEKGERMIVEALFGLLLKIRSKDKNKQDEIWELDWMSGENKITDGINKILSSNIDTINKKVESFLDEVLHNLTKIRDFLEKYSQTIRGNELFHNELDLNRYTFVAMIEGKYTNETNEYTQLENEPKDSETKQWLNKQELNLDTYANLKDEKFILTLPNNELLNQKLIERAEFSIFKVDKHPYSMFLDKPIDTAHNYKYKELFLLKGISWRNYRYFLFVYEKFDNPNFDYKKQILDAKINEELQIKNNEEKRIKIEREHLFAQNPSEEYWDKIKSVFSKNKTEYTEWINEIGNILLLPKHINIKVSNAMPWEKAKYILKDKNYGLKDVIFKSTFDFFMDIYNECNKKRDSIDKINVAKELCEQRTKKLKSFIWNRF